MSPPAGAVSVLRASGDSDAGLQRDVNEDRFHIDLARRIFMVIDGVGGQAAGGKAADTAVGVLRSRLERETGPVIERLREAITAANNEIHRVAGLRPEWNGMACVLTVVVLDDTRAAVGHVGDTRLYKIRRGGFEKVTRDHSPVGEREDAHELSELEAMHHPRRNEVYRDVGSERHGPNDADFMDVGEIPFEPDSALLLCSDGLTDLVDSSAITQIIWRLAGKPDEVVSALIAAANEAGGKDNVTVVYVEGEQFAAIAAQASAQEITRRLSSAAVAPALDERRSPATVEESRTGRALRSVILVLLTLVLLFAAGRPRPAAPLDEVVGEAAAGPDLRNIVVGPGQSIATALLGAEPGTTIIVEPGEYRETVTLKSHVRLVSRVRQGATIRLPGTASESDAAIVGSSVTDAALDGFRIVGDAATALGVGVNVTDSELVLTDLEITGAAKAAMAVDGTSRVRLIGSDIHDNPGAALAVSAGANATISHNVFMRNGSAAAPQRAFMIAENSAPQFEGNVFFGVSPDAFGGASDRRATLVQDNWFVDARTFRVARPRPEQPQAGKPANAPEAPRALKSVKPVKSVK